MKLTWNSNAGRYQCTLPDGRLIEVDGDVFAENRADIQKAYMEEGMDEEQAYEKADTMLRDPLTWYGDLPKYGLFINGVSQDQ